MRYHTSIGLIFVLFVASSARADDGEAERIRAELLEQVNTGPAPNDLKAECRAMIQDDTTVPLDGVLLAGIFDSPDRTPHELQRREAYLLAALFRFRGDPKIIEGLFDHLTNAERELVLGILLVRFKSFINADYMGLSAKGLIAAIDLAQDPLIDRRAQGHCQDVAEGWLEMAAQTRNPGFGKMILTVIKTRVVEHDLRFNLVALAANRGKGEAVEVVQWYFETYCFDAFGSRYFEKYFQTYLHPTTARALIQNKRAVLEEAAKALADGTDAARADGAAPVVQRPAGAPARAAPSR